MYDLRVRKIKLKVVFFVYINRVIVLLVLNWIEGN